MAKAIYTIELVNDLLDEDVQEFKEEVTALEDNKESQKDLREFIEKQFSVREGSVRSVKLEVEE